MSAARTLDTKEAYAASEAQPLTAQRKLGRYVLLSKIAEGGMAEVYLGRTSGPGGFTRQVVIKKVLPQLAKDPRYERMLFEEARLGGLLNHPNLVAVYEAGRGAGPDGVFIAMEHIDGCNLSRLERHVAEKGQRVPLGIVVRIIADACAGLDHAHNVRGANGAPLRLIHRDISPENILLSSSGIAKVVDFGIAKAASSTSLTKTGEVKGKLSYVAPEQVEGLTIDQRVDVWALGVTLYKLCCGAKPFAGASEAAVLRKILGEEPPPPRTLSPRIDSELEAIILKALCKDREQRYQTARELQQALEDWASRHRQVITTARAAAYFREQFEEDQQLKTVSFASHFDIGQILEIEPSALLEVAPEPIAPAMPPPPPPEALAPELAGPSFDFGWLRPSRSPALAAAVAGLLVAASLAAAALRRPTVAPQRSASAASATAPSAAMHLALEPPQPTPDIDLDLSELAALAEAPSAPEPPPRARHRAVTSGQPAASPAATGVLHIQVMPWANVEIDGHSYGTTPLAPLTLLAGPHRLVLSNDELSVHQEQWVEVKPEAETLVRGSF